MITAEELFEFTVENLNRMTKMYNVDQWTITVIPESSDNPLVGFAYARIEPSKKRAELGFYIDNIRDLSHLEEEFEHELIHIVTADMITFYAMVEDSIPKHLQPLVDKMWSECNEYMNTAIRHMLRHGFEVGVLAERHNKSKE